MSTSPPGFPPALVERVSCFLAEGRTGTIELNIKDGRIIAGKVIEPFRIGECEPVPITSVMRRVDDNVRNSQT